MSEKTFVRAKFSNFNNSYTYQTTLKLKVDEQVIVDTPKNGLTVFTIAAIDVPKPDFECKWVAAQIDLEYYNSLPK